MKSVLFDSNIYDMLASDVTMRTRVAELIARGDIRVLATPIVADELASSPFGGLPDWLPIAVEPESVAVIGFGRIGMGRLGKGEVYTKHRGSSNKVQDGIVADSADALADILVTQDVPTVRGNVSPRDAAQGEALARNSRTSTKIRWGDLANAVVRGKIEEACGNVGITPPIICTPEELMEG